MGYRIGSVALIVFFLILSSTLCRLSAESRVVLDHITIAGYELQLEVREAKCILTFFGHSHRGELTLLPKPPCRSGSQKAAPAEERLAGSEELKLVELFENLKLDFE